MEEWIARRIDSPHVLKPLSADARAQLPVRRRPNTSKARPCAQWMIDNPQPDLETVRGIVEQIAAGLQAFHRMEMLHQDLRPENIMIDTTGTVKIIDFGSVAWPGVAEAAPQRRDRRHPGHGAVHGAGILSRARPGSPRSDLFSLGVIAYQMLTGRLPYGTQIARIRRKADVRRLKYRPADDDSNVPAWVDGALRRALHPDPYKRHEDLSEFVFELRTPNPAYLDTRITPLWSAAR